MRPNRKGHFAGVDILSPEADPVTGWCRVATLGNLGEISLKNKYQNKMKENYVTKVG